MSCRCWLASTPPEVPLSVNERGRTGLPFLPRRARQSGDWRGKGIGSMDCMNVVGPADMIKWVAVYCVLPRM